MILLDYSQVCVAAILAFSHDLKRGTDIEKKDLIRHVALNSIKSYKKKYGKEYGQMVIACDGRNYWRKEYFANYKGLRKKAREESELDWKFIFETLNEIREDLKSYFSYKVIHVDRCEADDVIAVLAESTQEFGKFEPVMIVSSDKDFKQLHAYENVKQFSPMLKKLVVVNKKELKEWLVEHIVKGDSGDGIPNILTKDDALMIGERQKSVSSKRLEEFFERGYEACRNDEERRNWQRNIQLVDFKYIPEDVKQSILDAFETPIQGSKSAIMNYLIKNRCRNLLNEIEEF
jgi:hypothetical protein